VEEAASMVERLSIGTLLLSPTVMESRFNHCLRNVGSSILSYHR
jgi:hypothetical protein